MAKMKYTLLEIKDERDEFKDNFALASSKLNWENESKKLIELYYEIC